jgi:hypothetical protein
MAQSANVIAQQVSGNIQKTLATLKIGTSTSETAFSLNGNSIANIAASVQPLGIGSTGVFIAGPYSAAGVQSALVGTGIPFRVRIVGYATTGDSETVTINLYNIPAANLSTLTSTVFTGAIKIATTGAVTIATTTGVFELHADVQAIAVSATSATLKGTFGGNINGTVVAATTLSSSPSGLLGEGDLNFFATATVGTGNALDVIQPVQLSIETIT